MGWFVDLFKKKDIKENNTPEKPAEVESVDNSILAQTETNKAKISENPIAEPESMEAEEKEDYQLPPMTYVDIKISEEPAPKGYVDDADSLPFSNVTKKTSRKKLGNFVAVDVETTGLYPSKSEIIEVAAIRFRDFKPTEVFTTLCKPKKDLEINAQRVNGITMQMLEDKPQFAYIAESLLHFIGKDNLVAHNLNFDLRFIVKHGVEVYNVERKYYCTLEIAQRTLKAAKDKWDKELDGWVIDFDKYFDVENYKLETLCKYYKIPLPKTHRALNDCLAAGYLLEALTKDRE